MNETQSTNRAAVQWPVYIVLLLLVGVSALFLIEFITASGGAGGGHALETLTAESYLDEVEPLLAAADPARGSALIDQYGCGACHRVGVANNLAPSFVGLAERAASQRPPLTAPAYLYESILYPDAFKLEGYTGVMPHNYPTIIPDEDLGHIIAYLLTPEAE